MDHTFKLNADLSKQQLAEIEDLYYASFPPEEQKPFSLILSHDNIDMMSIEDDYGQMVGLVILLHYQDMTVLDYFALAENQQGQGIGTSVLSLLLDRYQNQRFLIEIEHPQIEREDYNQRIRRKNFYLNHSQLQVLPFIAQVYGVTFELLSNASDITFQDYVRIYQSAYGDDWDKHIKRIS